MEKSQAEAVARAILEPKQDELRRKRVVAKHRFAEGRNVAWFALAGALLGAGAAHFTGYRAFNGALLGGSAAAVIARLFIEWRRPRIASENITVHAVDETEWKTP